MVYENPQQFTNQLRPQLFFQMQLLNQLIQLLLRKVRIENQLNGQALFLVLFYGQLDNQQVEKVFTYSLLMNPGSSKENYSSYWPAIKDQNQLSWTDINHQISSLGGEGLRLSKGTPNSCKQDCHCLEVNYNRLGWTHIEWKGRYLGTREGRSKPEERISQIKFIACFFFCSSRSQTSLYRIVYA